MCWCGKSDVASLFGFGASSKYPDEEVYLGGLATMYGVLPWLQNLWDLEERVGEEEEGFKVIIWGWEATNGIRVDVTYDCCLSLYLYIQETLQSKVYTRVSNLKNLFMV